MAARPLAAPACVNIVAGRIVEGLRALFECQTVKNPTNDGPLAQLGRHELIGIISLMATIRLLDVRISLEVKLINDSTSPRAVLVTLV